MPEKGTCFFVSFPQSPQKLDTTVLSSASLLAKISVRSPRRLFILIVYKTIFWIKVSKKVFFVGETEAIVLSTTGTPFYCAPELLKQKRLLQASDVFSFGVIMWELLMNCPPFVVREGIFERNPLFPKFSYSAPLNYMLLSLSCMSVEPTNRPTFSEVITICQRLKDDVDHGFYVDALRNV